MTLFVAYMFLVALVLAAIIFWIGAEISPKVAKSDDKVLPYAGGERVEHELVPVSIKLFDYALLFMVFDVIALLFAFSLGPFGNTLDFVSKVGFLVYVGIVSFALVVFGRRV